MNDELGDNSRTWSSWALTKALMATMPSPPGRFSITTGWPHFLVSRSASSRALMSAPLPGPSVRMNLTGRVGQFCAVAGVAPSERRKQQGQQGSETRARRM